MPKCEEPTAEGWEVRNDKWEKKGSLQGWRTKNSIKHEPADKYMTALKKWLLDMEEFSKMVSHEICRIRERLGPLEETQKQVAIMQQSLDGAWKEIKALKSRSPGAPAP